MFFAIVISYKNRTYFYEGQKTTIFVVFSTIYEDRFHRLSLYLQNYCLISKILSMVTTKMKKLLLMSVVATSLLSSCSSTFYQVYEVKSNALKQTDNSLVYENEDLKVMYNLWCSGGSMNFIVQNKTGRDLFLDMGQSFFIFNGRLPTIFKTVSSQVPFPRQHRQVTASVCSPLPKDSGPTPIWCPVHNL